MKKIILGCLVGIFSLASHAGNLSYEINAKDGDDKIKLINISITQDSENKKEIEKEQVEDMVQRISKDIKRTLKNEYTYIPRSGTINQQGQSFLLTMKYTAKNSYGADVVSEYSQNYIMQENGKLK